MPSVNETSAHAIDDVEDHDPHQAPALTLDQVRALQRDAQADQRVRDSAACWAQYRHRLPSAAGAPAGWHGLREGEDGAAYERAGQGRHAPLATVIESVAREADGRVWHHVSVARRDRDPTWQELVQVKEQFIGDREAYLVAPPALRYVNLHQHALHWFSCLDAAPDGAVLPDFSGATSQGRTI